MFIKNDSSTDIINYPINFRTYTMKAGETIEVPKEVAAVLTKRYGFVSEVGGLPKSPTIASVVESVDKPVAEKAKPMDTTDYNAMSYRDLQKLYTEKFSKKSVGLKKADLVKALENM